MDAYGMMSKQESRVYKHLLEEGSITPMVAWKECGVYRLSSVIHRLRRGGIPIATKEIEVTNRYGESCTVACYVFEGARYAGGQQ